MRISAEIETSEEYKDMMDRAFQQGFAIVKSLAEQDKFTPMIDRSYPLDRIQKAYEYVASGQKIGNVVVKMWED